MWSPFAEKDAPEEKAMESAFDAAAMKGMAPQATPPESLLEMAHDIMMPGSTFIPVINKDMVVRFITKPEQIALTRNFAFIETLRKHLIEIGYDPLHDSGAAKPVVSEPFIFLNLSGSVNGQERKSQTTQTLRFEKGEGKRSWLK